MLRSRNTDLGSSLAVWWLGFWAFTAQVQSLVRQLRSCKCHGVTKQNTKTHRPRGHLLRTEPTGFSVGWTSGEGENEASKRTLTLTWASGSMDMHFSEMGKTREGGQQGARAEQWILWLEMLINIQGKMSSGKLNTWVWRSVEFFAFNIYLYKIAFKKKK